MRISIHHVQSEILLQTVTLSKSKTDPDNTYLFRCYHCGTAISRIQGDVVGITAGLIPNSDAIVIHQCYKCKENYVFQTLNGTSKFTSLTISQEPTKLISTFHCVICRTQLFQYNNNVVALLPETTLLILPTLVRCIKPDCKKDYLLKDVVASDIIITKEHIRFS
jgi:hypothetical protein